MTGISRICNEFSFPLLRDYSQTTSAEKNLDIGQDRSQSALWSAVKVSDYRRRLGLHRPGKMALSCTVLQLTYFLNLLYVITFSISYLSAKGPYVSADQTWYAP